MTRIRLPFWLLALVFGLSAWTLLGSAIALAVWSTSPLRDYAADGLVLSAVLLVATMAAAALLIEREEQS